MKRTPIRYTHKQKARSLALYAAGFGPAAIERETGVRRRTAMRWAREAGIQRPRACPSPEIRAFAVALYEQGDTYVSAAYAAGVSAPAVWQWVRQAGVAPRRNKRTLVTA